MMVIAKLMVSEGKEEEFEALCRELAQRVRDHEPGCSLYQLCRHKDGSYMFVERYADKAALDAHGASAHFQEYAPKLGACLSGPMELQFLKEVG